MAVGEGAQREHGRGRWAGDRAGDQGGGGCHQGGGWEVPQLLVQLGRAVTSNALRALMAWVRDRVAVCRATRSTRIISTCRFRPWGHGGLAGLDRAGGGLGVGRVGLAAAAAGLAVGSVDSTTTWPLAARKRARAAP